MIKTIVFDFGNVLIDWSPYYLYSPYFRNEETCRYFVENVIDRKWFTQIDKGRPMDVCTAELTDAYPEYAQPISFFRDRWFEMCHGQIEGMQELVEELRERGYGIYGLSNWPAETFPGALERFPVLGLMEGYVVSSYVNLVKPDIAIYKSLIKKFGLNPSESLFIDDREENVEGARKAGMKSLRFDGVEALKDSLQTILELGINRPELS